MILSSFFLLASCGYIEFDSDNVDQYVGGSRPVFVKFYSPNCFQCRKIIEGFLEASSMFADVVFGGVDCMLHDRLCDRFPVSKFPTLLLFPRNSTDPITFDGERSALGFADFVESRTHVHPKRPPTHLVALDPLSFPKFLESTQCGLVLFHATVNPESKPFIALVKGIADVFAPEPNISIGAIACDRFREFCDEYQITLYPDLKLLKDNRLYGFSVGRSRRLLVEYLNENCGTNRGADGLLGDSAGTIPEADALVTEFLNANDKLSVITKMKQVPGSDFYVTVMERYLATGKAKLENDVKSMWGLLSEKKGSVAALDRMKERYNVLGRFAPTPDPGPDLDEI
jgi:protein disulfide-isomerase A6